MAFAEENLTRWDMRRNDFEAFSFDACYRQETPLHYHIGFYEVYLFLEGSVTYHIQSEQYDLCPGDILLIPPGMMHWPVIHTPKKPYRRVFLWIDCGYLRSLGTDRSDLTECFSVRHGPRLIRLSNEKTAELATVIRRLSQEPPAAFGEDIRRRARLTLLMADINEAYRKAAPPAIDPQEKRIRDILAFIDAHLSDKDLSVDKIASAFYLSKSGLSKAFKSSMGINVHRYISRRRAYSVQQYIAENVPLKNIPALVGYADYSSFYRAFRGVFGLSPRAARQLRTETGRRLDEDEFSSRFPNIKHTDPTN